MEKILRGLSKSVILLNEMDFTDAQIKSNWLGYAPATDAAIEAAEKRLNCSLPTKDFRPFEPYLNAQLLPILEQF